MNHFKHKKHENMDTGWMKLSDLRENLENSFWQIPIMRKCEEAHLFSFIEISYMDTLLHSSPYEC